MVNLDFFCLYLLFLISLIAYLLYFIFYGVNNLIDNDAAELVKTKFDL